MFQAAFLRLKSTKTAVNSFGCLFSLHYDIILTGGYFTILKGRFLTISSLNWKLARPGVRFTPGDVIHRETPMFYVLGTHERYIVFMVLSLF